MNRWLTTYSSEGAIKLSNIPQLTYDELFTDVCSCLDNKNCHVASYFAVPNDHDLLLICIILDDTRSSIHIASYIHCQVVTWLPEDCTSYLPLKSITATHHSLHVFEREMTEKFGIKFIGAPWDKPLRFDSDRADKTLTINNYPFYDIAGESLHEVNVGPIHAGVIEPGVFRFICNGEEVIHLEIVLGYQHRGVEKLIRSTKSILRQNTLCESIAGDSVVAHATAYVSVIEKLASIEPSQEVDLERAIALELERVAMHIADCGALCMDIGYQFGQVACEALRTLIINTTQLWCGNRFAKGLIRPNGTYYTLNKDITAKLLSNIDEVSARFNDVSENLQSTPYVLARFEDCGVVNHAQSIMIGAVGQAARASSLVRDIRTSHPWGIYGKAIDHKPITESNGDVFSRLKVRLREVEQSLQYIKIFVSQRQKSTTTTTSQTTQKPHYDMPLGSDSLAISLVEGWRGEVCHVAITDHAGEISYYKIKDPSIHNWLALALSVRGLEISDFPICNKSFNLSYCGHDL